MSTGPHPVALRASRSWPRAASRAPPISATLRDGTRVETAGTVVVRQRPGTAKGFFFVTLEDETGFSNAIVTPQRFAQDRTSSPPRRRSSSAACCKTRTASSASRPTTSPRSREIARRRPSHDFH